MEKRPSEAIEEVRIFKPSSTIHPSGTNLPGENWHILYLRTKYNISYSILIFVLYIISVGGDYGVGVATDNESIQK